MPSVEITASFNGSSHLSTFSSIMYHIETPKAMTASMVASHITQPMPMNTPTHTHAATYTTGARQLIIFRAVVMAILLDMFAIAVANVAD